MSEEEANARLAYGSAVTMSPRSIKSAAAKVAAEPSSGDKSDTRCAIVSVASVSRKNCANCRARRAMSGSAMARLAACSFSKPTFKFLARIANSASSSCLSCALGMSA